MMTHKYASAQVKNVVNFTDVNKLETKKEMLMTIKKKISKAERKEERPLALNISKLIVCN